MNHFVLVFETNSIGRGPKTALLINTKEKSNHIVCSLDFSVCLPKILASAEIFYTDVEEKKWKSYYFCPQVSSSEFSEGIYWEKIGEFCSARSLVGKYQFQIKVFDAFATSGA